MQQEKEHHTQRLSQPHKAQLAHCVLYVSVYVKTTAWKMACACLFVCACVLRHVFIRGGGGGGE